MLGHFRDVLQPARRANDFSRSPSRSGIDPRPYGQGLWDRLENINDSPRPHGQAGWNTVISKIAILLILTTVGSRGQTLSTTDAQKILDRLDRLETENQRLSQEIADLKKELAEAKTTPDPPPQNPEAPQKIEERLDVQETRTAELEQKKVESSQKFPVQLTGMLLFNAFANGKYAGNGLPDPVVATIAPGPHYTGATFRQTVLGLKFSGPELPGGGTVSGSVYMDFFGGTNQPTNNLFRLRVATIDLNWKNTTITVGQDKPIIAPREPTSLAEVGVSPLTAAGNLWLWQPQARIEQRFTLTDRSQIRAQAGIYEMSESSNSVPAEYASTLAMWRPAYQGRVEYSYSTGVKRFEVAPSFSGSTSHVIGRSVDSRVASIDWLIRPSSIYDFSGAWFIGKDFAGMGSLRQGFTILSENTVIPVHGYGGWGQFTLNPAQRWSLHFFAGEEDDRDSDLRGNAISHNVNYGANAIWKLAPNILAAFEVSQVRTNYLFSGLRLNNHYDLALAYLF